MEKYKPYLMKPENGNRYFDKLREAYNLIDRRNKAVAETKTAPQYYARGWNQAGEPYGIYENFGPWEELEEAERAIQKNEMAQRILKAAGREETP